MKEMGHVLFNYGQLFILCKLIVTKSLNPIFIDVLIIFSPCLKFFYRSTEEVYFLGYFKLNKITWLKTDI